MALETLLGMGDVTGLVTLAGLISSFPMAGHRGRLKEARRENRSAKEKEFGPPDPDDFLAVWEGLCQVRRSDHYGLSSTQRRDFTPDRDIVVRISSLCRRAEWRRELRDKLVALALKRNHQAADNFYPGHGIPLTAKSKLTYVECKKVLKYMKEVGLLINAPDARLIGHPIFEYAHRPEVFARAFAMQAGRPNDTLSREKHQVVYEFFSLDVGQVLSEQGRYYLMKGCAEVTTDPKLGLVQIRLFQRWGPRQKRNQYESRPIHAMDEEYDGHLFSQDDIVYALAFKSERGPHGHEIKDEGRIRRNMVSMVLSGMSRDSDGFHRKLTGGQLGQGIGGTVGVLAAPCVFYLVSDSRIDEIKSELQEVDKSLWTKLTGPNFKGSLKYEVLKWDSGFIDLLNGVDQRYAPVMADLDVPMPLPPGDEEGGPEVFVLGKGQG